MIGEISIGEGADPCPPPLDYAYAPIAENQKGLRKFSTRFLAFSNEISTVQKIVLSSSREQGNFRGSKASRPRPRTSKCVLEDSNCRKPKRSPQIFHKVSGVFQRNFNCSKNSAVLEPRTGQFSRI